MKQLLLSLLLLAGLKARSQDYIPLLNDNSWYVNFYGFLAANDDNQWVSPVGDVIFNDTTYTHYQESYSLNPNMPQEQNDYYIREDIDEKRVYTRIGGQEHLLYDFSLEVGDEVSTLVEGEWIYTFAVVAKDSFAVDAGRKRVRLFLEDTSDWGSPVWEEWIEGIGSRDHPLKNFELLMPDANYQVLCNHYGEDIPYAVEEFNGEPFTCPGSEVEVDYIPLINNNSFYIHRLDFGYDDTHWTLPIGTTTVDDMEYTHYHESFEGLNGTVENDYYIREDTVAKKVYKLFGDSEYLLYDFSLQVGDNVTLHPAGDPMEFTVVAKDSFAVNVGRQRVRLFLEQAGGNDEGQEVWIEGLGNLHHPLTGFNDYIQDPVFTLLCNNYDGEAPYTVAEFMSEPFTCPEVGERHDEGLSVTGYAFQSISVYPNPFSESFIISTNIPLDNATLTLHDVLGRVISEMPVSGNEIEVPRDNLPKGIYLLRIWQEGRPVIAKKVVADYY